MMDQRVETIDQLVSFQHIQVQLQGGAPWGFTLKGGLEHGEPLIVSKIEDGGKAALSKKLGVGDELVSINGSALYGSRQEALVLIKGSYRILKMVVRRRNVPVIRPHSWHLAKLSEHQPDSPAMQFHPGSFSLSWHSGCESSDLSMQWNQLSRHCSTDRSSSIGSMESLDPPSQGYYEGQLSPVDQSVFHNKRDSAYSSFSASSNTSDYTVSLKPDEASSMDNLHGLGPCRYAEGRCVPGVVESGGLSEDGKPCCLSQHSEVKGRLSSYSYGEDSSSSASKGPPPPPIRRESFKATRTGPGCADKRRASDPVHMLSQSGNWTSDTLLSNKLNCNPGCSKDARNLQQNSAVDQYYMLSSQLEQCKSCSPEAIPNEGYLNQHSTDASRQKNYSPCVPEEFGCLGGKSEALGKELSSDGPLVSTCLKKEHLMGHHGHRHSAPEKLLSLQLQSLDLSSRRDGSLEKPAPHDPYVWKGSPLRPQEEENLTSKEFPHPATKGYNAEWAESRCSTPGSVTASEIVEPRAEADTIDGHLDVGSCNNRTWGRCFSVPGEMPKPVPETIDLKNTGLTSASSVDTLLGEARTYEKSKPEVAAKPAASRQHRSSKARRRNERFATNLRNEIQRKKAQLQKSRGSSTLLYGEETVEEVNEQPEYDSPCSDSSPSSQGRESKLNKTTSPAEVHISRPDARSQEAILHETRSSPRHQKVHQNTSCRSPSPQQTGPLNTSCRSPSPQQTGPQNTSCRSPSPQQTGPQNIRCRSPSPQQTGPQNISCRTPSLQQTGPQNISCRSPSPQQTSPQNISCRGPSPQLKLPQNTSCRSPSPQQTGPQNTSCRSPSPQQTGPQNIRCRSSSLQQTGPQNIRCRSPSPQQTSPQNISCRSPSPQQTGPQNIRCRSPSPQQTGPQNTSCRSPSPQQTGPQNIRCRSSSLQQTGPQNIRCRSPSPQQTSPQNISCRSPSPQQTGPQNVRCRSPSLQQTGPQNISCRIPSPQQTGPQNISCRIPSPQQTGPQNVRCRSPSLQQTGPQNIRCRIPSPQQTGPQNISCRIPSPQQTGPQNVRCRSPSLQQTGPQNISCRSPSPQQTGPQNVRCRSPSLQQTGPQNISCRSPSPQQTGPQNISCISPPQLKLPQNSRCRSPPLQQTGPQNFGSRFRETTHRTPSPEISEKKEDHTHGRGGRWKWTPEHKLQPQVKPEKENHSRMTSDMVRPSKPAPTLASKESDILPFADRRKFFEESSKSLSSSHLPNLPVRHNKSDLNGKYLEKPNCNPNHSYCPGERKYSKGQTYHSHEVLSAYHPTELRPVEQQTCCNQDKDEADLDHSCCYRIRASETMAHKPKAYFVSEDCRTLPHRHRQPCDHCLHTRNSDFYPTPVAVYEECASHHVYNPARKPLFETFPVEEQEQTKINRKASLTESVFRDFQCCRNSCQLGDAARQPQDNFESRWIHHRAASSYDLSQDQHSTSWTTTPLEGHSEGFVKYPQRGRALSESNIRVDLQRLQRLHMREFGGPPALCELEEPRPREEEAGKKKGPPPPRPPPPNWEKYKHRRASHSALCSLPTSQRTPPLGYNSSPSDSSPPPCSLETSRQRSRSLPLREPPENYLRCFHEPHELLPANHRSALVPKTCNQLCCAGRQDSSCELHGDPVSPRIPDSLAVPAAAGLRSRRSETSVDKEAMGVPMYTHQKVMCHEKRSVYGNLLCFSIKPEKGSEGLAESYFAMNYEQNGDLYRRPEEFKKAAPTTTRSILIQPEENILETNIDEYRHEDAISEDLPACYQSPQETPTHLAVSVLETDIDTVPEEGEGPPQLEVVKAALVNLTPEELLRDIVSTNSSLAGILDPCSRLTAADLMEEIFPRSEENRPAEKRRNNRNVLQLNVDIQPERCSPLAPSPTPGPSVSPTSCSSYYSISAGKAELLNRVKELPGMEEEEEEDDELAFKKQQLIDSLSRKLSVLREAQQSLLEDIGANCTLGEEVESLVQTICKPNELDKFRMFIGDLEKVVSLLLSLSGRLARVENALSGLGLEASHDERLALTEKKKQLSEQLGEARELKEHVDRRERVVLEVLSRYLTEEQLKDYRHFVKMKSGLIIEQRQLEEKIRLGEEQLRCLRESLGMGLAHC